MSHVLQNGLIQHVPLKEGSQTIYTDVTFILSISMLQNAFAATEEYVDKGISSAICISALIDKLLAAVVLKN
jgi:hypothetical protein